MDTVDVWLSLWAHHQARAGLVDPDWEEHEQLFDRFEAVEMEWHR